MQTNSAATLKALLIVKKLFDGRIMFQPDIRKAHKAVEAALAAPPRNCDTLETYDDFVDAWNNHIRSRTSADEPMPGIERFLYWLSSTRQKGAEDDKKD